MLTKDKERAAHYLHSSTEPKLMETEELSRMFRLFSRMEGGLFPVSTIFKKNEKKEVVGSPEQDFVWKVIELHDKYITYVANCLQDSTVFHKALKEAFEVFCNKDIAGCTSAELLAAFCDSILRKGGSEKLSDEAIEEALDKVVNLVSYVSDKDLFFEFHRKKLGRRLLFDKSANDEHERSIVSKLKHYFGGQFTSKMECMLNDVTTAREQ